MPAAARPCPADRIAAADAHPRIEAPSRSLCSALLLAVILAAGSSAPADAQRPDAASRMATAASSAADAAVAEASARFAVPASWIHAVIQIESGGDARAVSPKGARGLMQIMPETWERLRLRYSLGDDPFDARANILGGTAYLRELYDRFGAGGFLAAYNAGPGRYLAYLTAGVPLAAETRAYLGKLAARLPDLGRDPALAAAAAPLDWRRSGLFAASPVGFAPVDLATPTPDSGHASSDSQPAIASRLAPLSDGLFAAFATASAR